MTANLPEPPPITSQVSIATRLRNLLIVLVAVVLSATVFFGLRTQTNSVSLTTIAEDAVPLEVALGNGKPTLMEFYANWCTSCQAMAKDVSDLKQQYGNRVNFVMLNVDNTKWLPEILHYRVDGIPHFVYLNQRGETLASAIGEQPRAVLEENLVALTNGEILPYAKASGRTSEFSTTITNTPSKATTDPRSHSNQVVN